MQSKEDVTTNLVERLDWRVVRCDESRIARQLWKKPAVDAIYSLEAGAILDEFVHFLDAVGVLPRWQALQGDGIQREMVDFFHIPPSLVVDRGSSYVEDCSALDFPFIHDTWPYDLTQNKLSNINWLKFYH